MDSLPDPVLRDFHTIEHRDALIAYDAFDYALDDHGLPLTRWDGVTVKPSPITGEPIPDESARLPVERYLKLRSGEALTAKDQALHQAGLVSVLASLHDELDAAVFAAYGWDDLAAPLVGQGGATTPRPNKPAAQAQAEEELLLRLVALNTRRAADEAQGQVHWLRAAYQNPSAATVLGRQTEVDLIDDLADDDEAETPPPTALPASGQQAWPKELREQIAAVRGLLTPQAQSADALAAAFKRKPVKAVQTVLDALYGLGLAQGEDGQWRA